MTNRRSSDRSSPRSPNKKSHAPLIKFNKEEKAQIVQTIQLYFLEELDQKIGGFDAEFLLDFFAEQIGVYFYNRGIYDAQAVLDTRIDDVRDAILELEKITDFPTR